MMNAIPNLGLTEKERTGVIEVLNTLLADEHILYTKLRNYHWNITGLQFSSLHEMFEEQYNAVKVIADEVAERTRANGGYAIGTLSEFVEHTRLEEEPGQYPDMRTMVSNLVEDHETIVRYLREDATTVAEKYNDAATEDLLIGLLQEHQKMSWMLRSVIARNIDETAENNQFNLTKQNKPTLN